jgi:hypothetical protein
MSAMRKIGVLCGALLAMAAITAAPASATADFPHEESASAWTAIEAGDYNGSISNTLLCDGGAPGGSDCSFSGSASNVGLVFFGVFSWGSEATISGDLGDDGEFFITKSSNMPTTSSYSGSICRHTQTREYWVRVVDSNSSAVMFGHLAVDDSGLASSTPSHYPRALEFGDPEDRIFTAVGGSSWVPFYAAEFGGMWDAQEVLIGQANGAPGCDWPELS